MFRDQGILGRSLCTESFEASGVNLPCISFDINSLLLVCSAVSSAGESLARAILCNYILLGGWRASLTDTASRVFHADGKATASSLWA
jgi:hypothetical protein